MAEIPVNNAVSLFQFQPPAIALPAPPPPATEVTIMQEIIRATQHDQINRCQEIIESGAYDVNQLDTEGVSLLHWSAINNRLVLSRYFLSKGADVNCRGGDLQGTPLHWAINQNHLPMVVLLLDHQADANICDLQGIPPLHCACQRGLTGIVAYLLAKGSVDVNSRDGNGATALMATCSKVARPDPARLLITMGADVNLTEPQLQSTAAHFAANTGNYIALKVLDKAGVDWLTKNARGETPLDLTERKNNPFNTNLLKNMMWERNQIRGDGPRILSRWTNSPSFRLKVMLAGPGLLFLAAAFTLHSHLNIYTKIGILLFTGFVSYFGLPLFMDKRQDTVLPCSLATSTTILIISSYYVLLLSFGGVWFGLFFVVCTVSVIYVFFRVVTSDPGFVPFKSSELNDTIMDIVRKKGDLSPNDICSSCLTRRPLRSKHCSDCDRCVARFDHHCPWIYNCVGVGNHHLFILYLICVIATCLNFMVVGGWYMLDSPGCYKSPMVEGVVAFAIAGATCHPWLLICIVVSFLHFFWVFGLLVSQLSQILGINMTTNEYINSDRYFAHLPDNAAHGHSHGGGDCHDDSHGHSHGKGKRKVIRSPYNKGILRNGRDLFGFGGYAGPKPVDWFNVYSLDEIQDSPSHNV